MVQFTWPGTVGIHPLNIEFQLKLSSVLTAVNIGVILIKTVVRGKI